MLQLAMQNSVHDAPWELKGEFFESFGISNTVFLKKSRMHRTKGSFVTMEAVTFKIGSSENYLFDFKDVHRRQKLTTVFLNLLS